MDQREQIPDMGSCNILDHPPLESGYLSQVKSCTPAEFLDFFLVRLELENYNEDEPENLDFRWWDQRGALKTLISGSSA